MADPRPAPRPEDAGAPRWVRVFVAVLVVLGLLFVVLHLRGGHGPGRHLPPREGR